MQRSPRRGPCGALVPRPAALGAPALAARLRRLALASSLSLGLLVAAWPALAQLGPAATPASVPAPGATRSSQSEAAAPMLTAVNPAVGSARGGGSVAVSGADFAAEATLAFRHLSGDLGATSLAVAGTTSLTAVMPPNPQRLGGQPRQLGDVNGLDGVTSVDALCILRLVAGLGEVAACPASQLTTSVDVVVVNPGGLSGSLPAAYTYQNADVNGLGGATAVDALCVLRQVAALPPTLDCPAPPAPAPPAIAAFRPTSGVVGSTVTVTGGGFRGATGVAFGGMGAAFTVMSDVQLIATVPGGALSGPISVTTPAGTAASAESFSVVASQPGVRLLPAAASVDPGAELSVVLQAIVPPSSTLGAWTVDVAYDPAVLALTACAPASGVCNPAYAPGRLRVAGVSSDGLAGEPALASLTFQARVGAAGRASALTPSVITFATRDGQPLSHSAAGASIAVSSAAPAPAQVRALSPAGTVAATLDPGTSGVMELQVDLPGAPRLGAWTVDLSYDPTVVALERCSSSLSTCGSPTPVSPTVSRLRVAGASSAGLAGTQTLASLTFQARLPAAGRASPLEVAVVTFTDTLGDPRPAAATSGSVAVSTARPPPAQVRALSPAGTVAATLDPGQAISLEVRADLPSGPRLGAWTVDVGYDPATVAILGCAPGAGTTCNPGYAAGTVRLTGSSSAGLSGPQTFGSLTFQARLAAAGRTSPLVVSVPTFADVLGDPLPHRATSGSLAVTTAAVPSTTLSLEPASATVAPGGSTSVELRAAIPDGLRLGAWTVDVGYDPAVVSASGCSSTTSTCSTSLAGLPNTARFTGSASAGLAGLQTLGSVTFAAVGGAGASGTLTVAVVTLTDPVGDSLPRSASDGTIRVATGGAQSSVISRQSSGVTGRSAVGATATPTAAKTAAPTPKATPTTAPTRGATPTPKPIPPPPERGSDVVKSGG